jgi:glycosyltransferase involved in cell wall biosynthesis
LKIVHVTETLVSGVQAYLRSLSAFIAQNAPDAEVYIIYSGLKEHFDKAVAEELFKGNATLVEVPMPASISPVGDFKAAVKIYREIKKLKPDVIHLHSSKAGVLGRVAAFFYGGKKKLFYTPHGYAFLRSDVGNASRRLYKGIEKYSQLLLGGTTIACGDTEYEIAKGFGKAQLVRNGITLNPNDAECPELHNNRLTLGIVGRITPQRAPELFNSIALRFPQAGFVWIGDGDRSLLTAPNITVTGWLFEPEQVNAHICRLDVYLHTSLWEGLPYAILEAMYRKKPVVATNVIGNKDAVEHGHTGFLFDKIEELDAFMDALKNPQVRTDMGQKGFERTRDGFNNQKSFTQLLELYRG